MIALGSQTTLRPWSDIPAVQNVSGVGSYTATFKVPRPCALPKEEMMVVMDFGTVYNTMQVWINGNKLPAINAFDAKLDVTDFLTSGTNTIEVETTSTLFNAVKGRLNYVKTNNAGPQVPIFYTAVPNQPHGLVGPVELKIFRKVTV
jgi:hypothetical protein